MREDYIAEDSLIDTCVPMADYSFNRNSSSTRTLMKHPYTICIRERPYFHEYCRIVAEYTQRELSFKSDRLVAIVGILNIFAQAVFQK